MQNTIRQSAYTVAILLILYYTGSLLWWSWLHGDTYPAANSANQPVISRIERINTNAGRGNLLGVQPWMTPDDYRDGLRFRKKLHTYLQIAKDSGLIVPRKTIVVFPEYLGTWLVALNEPNRVYTAKTVQDALTTMVLSSPVQFLNAYRSTPDAVTDRTKYALFA